MGTCGSNRRPRGHPHFMILGITGGLGCGKSTAARAFERHGFRRLDSDQIVRDDVLTAPDVMIALRARYGEAVIQLEAGRETVNRPALAERVFPNEGERLWLEELTHPRVFVRWRQAFAAEPAADWVVEVPLLHEMRRLCSGPATRSTGATRPSTCARRAANFQATAAGAKNRAI